MSARHIEIAASLDPNNSLVRSYLGKTYYEEKRTSLTDREYATAKELKRLTGGLAPDIKLPKIKL